MEVTWHGYQLTSSLSFCHSSHVVVYFILLSVESKFCSGLCGIFSSHTGQHEKLVPVSPVQSILCTYCQIIHRQTVTLNYFILQTKCLSAITNDVFVYQAVVEWWCMVTIRTSLLLYISYLRSRLFSAKCKSIIPIINVLHIIRLNTCHFICPY